MVSQPLTYVTITKGSSSVKITLKESGISHQMDKQIKEVSQPSKTGNPVNLLLDLGRLKEAITFNGWLESDSTSTGYAKKKTLRDMLKTAGSVSLKWDDNDTDQPYTGTLLRADIKEENASLYSDQQLVDDNGDVVYKTFDIQIVFATGDSIG